MTTNLRICANNLVETGSFVSNIYATSTAGLLTPESLLNSDKSKPWRSASVATEQFILIHFTATKQVNMLAAMFTNLSPSAIIHASLYTLVGDVSPAYVSPATPVFNSYLSDQAVAPTGNTYATGAGSNGVIYFPEMPVQKIALGIIDTGNPDGYVQVGNLVVGKYWSPVHNFARGATVQIIDDSKVQRAESGDFNFGLGNRFRKLSIALSNMEEVDRLQITTMLRTLGITSPLFISLFPLDADPALETLYTLQGVIESIQPITNTQFSRYSLPLTLNEL